MAMKFARGIAWIALLTMTRCAHNSGPAASSKDLVGLRETVAAQSEELEKLRSDLRKFQLRDPEVKPNQSSSVPVVVLTPQEELEAYSEDEVIATGGDGARVELGDIEDVEDRKVKPRLDPKAWTSVADSRHDVMPLYFRGLQMFKSKNYDGALDTFSRFLRGQPQHVYADRAQFFIAESHYFSGEYPMALQSTHQLENRFPHSLRIPEGLHRRALCWIQMGQAHRAADVWRDLLRRFPGEPVAKVASKQLADVLGAPK